MSITGKLFATMLKTAGVDSVIILDSPTPQLEGFFDMNVDNLKVCVTIEAENECAVYKGPCITTVF